MSSTTVPIGADEVAPEIPAKLAKRAGRGLRVSVEPVIVQTALPQPAAAALARRAQLDGRTVECELRLAVSHWLAWSRDRGELQHRDDVARDFPSGLPSDGALL